MCVLCVSMSLSNMGQKGPAESSGCVCSAEHCVCGHTHLQSVLNMMPFSKSRDNSHILYVLPISHVLVEWWFSSVWVWV